MMRHPLGLLLLLSVGVMNSATVNESLLQGVKLKTHSSWNWYKRISDKHPKYEPVDLVSSWDEACQRLKNLYEIAQELKQISNDTELSTVASAIARFVVKTTALQMYMGFFKSEQPLATPCALPGVDLQDADGNCVTGSPPGCLQCLMENRRADLNCSWIFGEFNRVQEQLNGSNPSRNLWPNVRYITIVNCSSERKVPEGEAKEIIRQLRVQYEKDLVVLQEGEMFLQDMKNILVELRNGWDQSTNRGKRSVATNKLLARVSQPINTYKCNLNRNDDPGYLAEQLKKTVDYWGDNPRDMSRIFPAACYVTKLNIASISEVFERRQSGWARNPSSSQKINDILSSAAIVGEKTEVLKVRIGSAKANVTRVLATMPDRVDLCV